jgi:hypothetical protein
MAERRMFTKKVTDDDNFMALSSSAQALYLHLSMSADDDGFCNQVSISMFKAHASIQDLQALLEKRYIYQFENGVIVIKHWRMANALRKDRYTPTAFQEELAHLDVKKNGAYTWLPSGCQVVAERLPQDSIDKDSIDKDSIVEVIEDNSASDNAPSKKDISDFFEKIWSLYPVKKGKGQVSDSKKKTLYAIGIDEMTRAIQRYKDDLSKEDWRKPQNGSTFFNSGYVDYLDANYTPLEPKKTTSRPNGYNQAPQRQYDMTSLETQLLNADKPKKHDDP